MKRIQTIDETEVVRLAYLQVSAPTALGTTVQKETGIVVSVYTQEAGSSNNS